MKHPAILALLLGFLAGCAAPAPETTTYAIPDGQEGAFQRTVAECRARAEAAVAPIPRHERDYTVYDNYNEIVEQRLRGRGYEPVR